jgi:hypothetical protein
MKDLERAFARLEKASKRLDDGTDRLNGQLEAANERLRKANAATTVWPWMSVDRGPYDDPEFVRTPMTVAERDRDDGFEEAWQLGFDRVKERWQLATRSLVLKQGTDPLDGSPVMKVSEAGKILPLLDAPRAVRLEALQKLYLVIEAIAARVEGMAESIEALPESQKKPGKTP